MNVWKILKREARRSLTIMLIPHNSIKPVRISFSLSFLLLIIVAWTVLTVSAGYIYSRHIDYLRVKADNRFMKVKVTFFARMMEQVKENDARLRTLLQMKSKDAIMEGEGKGGPSRAQEQNLDQLLAGKIYEASQEDINRQIATLEADTQKQLESYTEIIKYVDKERSVYNATPNLWPCTGGHVTSTFGFRIHPIFQENDFHSGLDIADAIGTPIYATADGVVRFSDWQPGYGKLIILEHGCGYRTYYGHLSRQLVKIGARVQRGQLIGLMGSTGTSTGSHVHYEVQFNGHATNPVKFLKKYPSQLSSVTMRS